MGIDVIELQQTKQGNRLVLVLLDLFSKWPMVFAMTDQKTEWIVQELVNELIPFCGEPEALLSV